MPHPRLRPFVLPWMRRELTGSHRLFRLVAGRGAEADPAWGAIGRRTIRGRNACHETRWRRDLRLLPSQGADELTGSDALWLHAADPRVARLPIARPAITASAAVAAAWRPVRCYAGDVESPGGVFHDHRCSDRDQV